MNKYSVLFTCDSITEVWADKVFILTFFIEFITSDSVTLKLDRDFVRRISVNDTILFDNTAPLVPGGDIDNIGG